MRLAFIQHLRAQTQRLHHRLGGRHWFPHVPLALFLGLGGVWILNARFGGDWSQYAQALMQGDFHLNLRLLPSLLIGGGMVTMGLGLLWRSRLAWVMAVLLGATGAVNT
jgi:voltage-gated potassium channel